jgi:hypothetical protein
MDWVLRRAYRSARVFQASGMIAPKLDHPLPSRYAQAERATRGRV